MKNLCFAAAVALLLAAGALAEGAAVVRPRYQAGKDVIGSGTAFFLAADVPEGAVAITAAHTFDLGKLTRATEVNFETGHSRQRASVSSRLLARPGKPFASKDASLRDDFMIFALDLKPSGARVLQADKQPIESVRGARVRLFGVPAGMSADDDDIFGTVRVAEAGRIEVRLDVPADLRGWGGAPVLRFPGDTVIGILEAAWPDEQQEGTQRLGVAPIGGVLDALAKPLAAGRGEKFATFAALAPKQIDATPVAVGDDVDIPEPEERQLAEGEALSGEAGAVSTTIKLEIEEPKDGSIVGSPEGAFLAGRALALLGEFKRFDVILVLDTSGSTSSASGGDINGNGIVGSSGLSGIFKATDPGDSILAAEVAAAKKVLESLDPRNTRVGLVTFAGTADQYDPYTRMVYSDNNPDAITEEPLTTNFERVVKSLDRVFKRGPDGQTNMTEAVRLAVKELKGFRGGMSKPDPGSQKVVLFFTDGEPTAPFPAEMSRENETSVLRAASQARRAGVQVHTFAIGPDALKGPVACVQLAAYTGGYFTPVSSPSDLPAVVDTVNFANLETLEIKNITNGAIATETIVNADGSFGALVPVQPGLNRLEVVAKATDGTSTRAEVTVSFAPGAASPNLPRELVAVRNRLLERRLIAIKRGRIETERNAADNARKDLEIKIKQDRAEAESAAERRRRSLRIEPAPDAASTPEEGEDEKP